MAEGNHPKLGAFTVDESTMRSSSYDPETDAFITKEIDSVVYEFGAFHGGAEEFYPSMMGFDATITDAHLNAFADFLDGFDTHVQTLKTAVAGEYWSTAYDLVDDLVISNPDMNLLGEMFPGEKLPYVSALTPEIFARHTGVTNAFGSVEGDEPLQITLDLRFLSGGIDQLLACRFAPDGMLTGIDQES